MSHNKLSVEEEISTYEKMIAQLKKDPGLLADEESLKLENKISSLKRKAYSNLTSWERVGICRHPQRPHSVDFIRALFTQFEEIHGDRLFRDDPAIITGFGMLGEEKCVVIAQEKGHDTETRIERNFGMAHPEGYRKALRVMKMAEKFSLPVICLIDTPGAYPGMAAEERGQGWAIAKNLWEMFQIKTPILCTIIGEGCSGGALGIGIGDCVGMLEHAYYSVISPEGCASILWKDAKKNAEASEKLKLHAENLLEFGIIDSIIEEPLGGAHKDRELVFVNTRHFLLKELALLQKKSVPTLLEERYEKFRKIGRDLV